MLAKVACTGDQVTVPVYPVPAVTVPTGAAPVTGGVTPAMAVAAMVVLVTGKTAVTTPELAELVGEVTHATVKKFAPTPVKVKPALAVRVIVAV